ncbi:MAG: gamma-glutamyl-gamma-aminobutyrate hydrolase family protein [Candidatus Sulfotelmatobacter sp.]
MSSNLSPRIAIPMPHSSDREYAERAILQYEYAVKLAGGEPVRIPLDQSPAEVMKMIERCDGALLPGSKADVSPAKFGASRSPHTADADPRRDSVDQLLLQDAYKMRKPLLGICYGLQSLNVYRRGSLIQHIPDFLPQDLRTRVNHEAGKTVAVAHSVEVENNSKLIEILCSDSRPRLSSRAQLGDAPHQDHQLVLGVNSSHHQSADSIGDGLRISARCLEDGIIEALEGTAADHFVIAVQWHPERSVDQDEPSRAIFRSLVEAAQTRHSQLKAAAFGPAK